MVTESSAPPKRDGRSKVKIAEGQRHGKAIRCTSLPTPLLRQQYSGDTELRQYWPRRFWLLKNWLLKNWLLKKQRRASEPSAIYVWRVEW